MSSNLCTKLCSLTLLGLLVLGVFLALPIEADAKDLGLRGQVFPIKEQDFRAFIKARLSRLNKTGQLEIFERQAKMRVARHAYRPRPLDLTTQSDTQVKYVDPSVVLKRDIVDEHGHVLVHAGTVVNPFKSVHLKEVLIFFNGDEKFEVNWVLHHYRQYHWVKFILTGGDIRDAAKLFGRIYFDQYGRIAKALHITHVPAIAEQSGHKWKITTIGSKEF